MRGAAVSKYPNEAGNALKFESSPEAQRLTSMVKKYELYITLLRSGDSNLEEVELLSDLQIIASRLEKWNICLALEPAALGLVSRVKIDPVVE